MSKIDRGLTDTDISLYKAYTVIPQLRYNFTFSSFQSCFGFQWKLAKIVHPLQRPMSENSPTRSPISVFTRILVVCDLFWWQFWRYRGHRSKSKVMGQNELVCTGSHKLTDVRWRHLDLSARDSLRPETMEKGWRMMCEAAASGAGDEKESLEGVLRSCRRFRRKF